MSKRIRLIFIFVNGILAVLVIYIFLLFIRDVSAIYLTSSKKPNEQISISPQKSIQQKALTDYAPLLRNNPFGVYSGELSNLGSKPEASKTAVEISLVGTVAGQGRVSYAIFADKNNMQEIFKIGDSVFGLGRLKKVDKDRVILDDKGKAREIQIADIITIKESYLSGKGNPFPDSFSGDRFAKKLADTSYVIDSQKLQQAIAHPNQIMTDARLLPNLTDGREEGFVLREVRIGGIYQSLGLQNGDTLLRINEYNISNPETALQAFTALKGMDRVQLEIIRSGSKMSMTYQIR